MRLNVELWQELYSETARHAEREGRSLSDVVRELLMKWNTKKRREEQRRASAEAQDGGDG
jgi:negative regulator of replication initiation